MQTRYVGLVRVVRDGYVIEVPEDEVERALALDAAADDEGTIQAVDMVPLFRGQPERHTTCGLATALGYIGAKLIV